jgi:acyl-coenzyme A synthetase/AMP-(fatty) acid ligase
LDTNISEHLPDEEQLTGGVQFVDQIPMTPAGKVYRLLLKQQFKQTELLQ